jgi:hypothetical protein
LIIPCFSTTCLFTSLVGTPAISMLCGADTLDCILLSVFYTGKPTKGVPKVVDCAVGIVIGRSRTRRYVQGHGTQDLYRFGSPRWRTLRPVWGIKYGAQCLVLG